MSSRENRSVCKLYYIFDAFWPSKTQSEPENNENDYIHNRTERQQRTIHNRRAHKSA